jgi:hypothetical protein
LGITGDGQDEACQDGDDRHDREQLYEGEATPGGEAAYALEGTNKWSHLITLLF